MALANAEIVMEAEKQRDENISVGYAVVWERYEGGSMDQIKIASFATFFIIIILYAFGTGGVTPAQNTMIQGYVKDTSNAPVNNTLVKISNIENSASDTAITDPTGYYSIEIPSGYASLSILDARYLSCWEFLNVSDNEIWFNVTLYPPHNATIYGYVLNGTNKQPIVGAKVMVNAINMLGEKTNTTVTDFSGYFEIDTYANMDVVIFVSADDYDANGTAVFVPEGKSFYIYTLEPKETLSDEKETTFLKEVFTSNILIAQLLIAVVCLVAILIIGNFILVKRKK
jgi:hypothetical protein